MNEAPARAVPGTRWSSAASAPERVGVVAAFDDERGLGTVHDDDGSAFPFHCTAIADGSRTVAPGTRVAFGVAPGHLGRLEGRHLRPLS